MITTDCPSREQLSNWCLGRLDEGAGDAVFKHVEHCLECENTVAQMDLDSDTLIDVLVQSAGQESLIAEPELDLGLKRVRDIGVEGNFREHVYKRPSSDETIPTNLREYELLGKLGEGAMGTVFKARHVKLKRIVALKVLRATRINDEASLARFAREIEAVGKLNHPNIVRAHDAGESDGVHFLVMELVDGIDVHRLVKQCGPLRISDACEIVRQTALGLQHAHEHGLVHRDIKPSNLLITAGGEVRVLDLGLALLEDDPRAQEELTNTGQVMGTVDYMAPEQASDSHQVDRRADVYSLGCTLYRLLTGQAPFGGPKYNTPARKLMAHAQATPEPLESLRDDVPNELIELLGRMIAKSPSERPDTADDVAHALERWATESDLIALVSQLDDDRKPDELVASDDEISQMTEQSDVAIGESQRNRFLSLRWLLAIAASLLVIASAAPIIIKIKREGKPDTIVEAAAGSKVNIAADGAVEVELPKKSEKSSANPIERSPPLPMPVVSRHKIERLDPDLSGDKLPRWAIARLGTVRLRHAGRVNSVAFCDDGNTIVSGSAMASRLEGIRGVRLWDAATGKELQRVEGARVFVAPDGRSFATIPPMDTGSKIRLFDVTGKEIRQFEKPMVYAVAFSTDGKMLAAGGADSENNNQINIWDLATGKELPAPQLGARFGYVERLFFSPDNKILFTEMDSGYGRIWDLSTGKEISIDGAREFSGPFVFWPDGKSFASSNDEAIVVRELATGKEALRFKKPTKHFWGTFSPNFQMLASPRPDGSIVLWDLDMETELHILKGHRHAVTCLAFSGDGKRLLSGSSDTTVRVWDVATGQAILPCVGHQGFIGDVVVSPDGETVISASRDKTVRQWNLTTGEEIRRFEHPWSVACMAVSPDGKIVAAKSRRYDEGSVIRLWDLATGREVRQWSAGPKDDESLGIAFSPDGRILATASNSAQPNDSPRVHQWDVETGKELCHSVVPLHESEHRRIAFIAFAPDGKSIAWSNYKFGHISQTVTGKIQQDISFFVTANDAEDIMQALFTPDGQTALFNLAEGGVCVWDIAKAEEVRRFGRREPDYSSSYLKGYRMSLSPDGKTLATAETEGVMVLWDITTGKELRRWKSHQGLVTALDWSADGSLLVSAGIDTTMLAWDVKSLLANTPHH